MFGIVLIITGIYNIIKFITNTNNRFFIIEIVCGILTIIAGILTMLNPFSLANMATIGIGIWLIISAAIKIATAIQLKRFKEETWFLTLIIAILSLIIGFLIIINPFESYIVLATYIGIMVCMYSAIDIVQQLLLKKRMKEIIKIFFE